MKVLVDMNLSPRWVQTLRAAQIEAIHWSDIGRANAPDAEIMAYASKAGYVVLTQDLDFSAILASTAIRKPSVVQIRSAEVSPEVIGAQVVIALL
jgi:predicted nuclease of predicted toxin-antitoxin system